VTGTGELQPKGILSYTRATTDDATRAWGIFQSISTGSANSFGTTTNGSDKLLDLIFALKAYYRSNAEVPDGPQDHGRRAQAEGRPGQLPDRPAPGRQLPGGDHLRLPQRGWRGHAGLSTGTNPASIAFGDFEEAYTIVDRLGITVVRDNITQPGFVKYHMRKRVGGGALNFEALKFLTF
jgi:predicted phage gp36 major capsid-like protein